MKELYWNNVVIKEGDDILVHKLPPYKLKDIPAPVIRYLTKCYYNHVATIVSYLGDLYVLEAVENGFVPTTKLSEYLERVGKEIEIRIIRPKFDISLEKQYKRLSKIVNKKYDFKSLLWYQLKYQLTGNKEWKGKVGDEAKNRVYCSEAVAEKYYEVFAQPYLVTPKDIHENKNFYTVYESKIK